MKIGFLSKRKAAIAAVLAAAVGVFLLASFREGRLTVYFLDVGQGDAAFIIFPCGRNMLVDGGDRRQENTDIKRFLRNAGVRKIDSLVLSHAHSDHLGGLPGVIANFPVELIVEPGYPHTTDLYMNFLQAVYDGNIPYRTASRGDAIEGYRGVSINFLNPPANFYGGESAVNNNSLVMMITYGSVNILFTGDIEREAESDLVGVFGERLDSCVLKVPHHGSRTSSTDGFLEAVRPAVAVISAGRGNAYGHPHGSVAERYESAGVMLFRTDEDGTVVVVTDGERITVRAQNRAARAEAVKSFLARLIVG